eukprot:Phypoly_transcript_18184.p1 GENE.Phypoly_transcript_18184~~Phypoly_transcript_18184.p1  ORF type:complete len:216 (+),score=21.35 Phypoly_transcript_18184:48-650(+)
MEAVKGLIAEKKRKILLGAFLTGASFFAYFKLRNLTSTTEALLKSKEFRLRTYFTDTAHTIASIVSSQVTAIHEHLANFIDIPQPAQLRNCKTKEEKILLWESLQIHTFARLLAGVYSIVLLNLLLHIQINLIGRYIHRDHVEQGPNSQFLGITHTSSLSPPLFDDVTQDKYPYSLISLLTSLRTAFLLLFWALVQSKCA